MADILVFVIVLLAAAFIFVAINLLNDNLVDLRIQSSIGLIYDADNKGAGITAILNSRPEGKPVMEEAGMLFVKGEEDAKKGIKESMEKLFGAVYKEGYIAEIIDSDKNTVVLRIEGAKRSDYTQAQFVIPKPGALATGVDGFLRIRI